MGIIPNSTLEREMKKLAILMTTLFLVGCVEPTVNDRGSFDDSSERVETAATTEVEANEPIVQYRIPEVSPPENIPSNLFDKDEIKLYCGEIKNEIITEKLVFTHENSNREYEIRQK